MKDKYPEPRLQVCFQGTQRGHPMRREILSFCLVSVKMLAFRTFREESGLCGPEVVKPQGKQDLCFLKRLARTRAGEPRADTIADRLPFSPLPCLPWELTKLENFQPPEEKNHEGH